MILGRVIEVVSGQSWEEYVQQHLFAPAGMTESATIAQEGQLPDMARGYVYAQGRTTESKPIAESWASAAGGIVSTAGDLQKWGDALSSGRIISISGYRLLTTAARLTDGTAIEYGFGLRIDRFEGQPRIWHHGNTSGYDGSDQFFPSQGIRIIVLTNTFDSGSDRIVERVYNDLFPDVAAAALRASAATQRSPAALLYSRALHVMDGLRQPKYLAYRMESTGDGVHIDFWADQSRSGLDARQQRFVHRRLDAPAPHVRLPERDRSRFGRSSLRYRPFVFRSDVVRCGSRVASRDVQLTRSGGSLAT